MEINDADSWQYLENTLQYVGVERFRVADVIEPTSDPTISSQKKITGEYLDGGSLIEAAVDDIICTTWRTVNP